MSAHAGSDNVHTRRIAEFVSGLTYEKIPAEVRERIKLLILDSLGCAIYGANLEWCNILRGTLEKLDATRTTSIWGTALRISVILSFAMLCSQFATASVTISIFG